MKKLLDYAQKVEERETMEVPLTLLPDHTTTIQPVDHRGISITISIAAQGYFPRHIEIFLPEESDLFLLIRTRSTS